MDFKDSNLISYKIKDMCPDYLPLNRTFLEFSADRDMEAAAFLSYIAERYGDGPLDWPKLLESRYVVILGEPGSGKTCEMLAQVRRLRAEGQNAFFVPMEALVFKPLDEAISLTHRQHFVRWRKSRQAAYFFLDAVDEAKLQPKLYAFRDTLENFRTGIGLSALSRANVVISCRVSEWGKSADLGELCSQFDMPADACPPQTDEAFYRSLREKDSQPPLLRLVTLAPLTRQQVEKLATHYGVTDVEAFLTATGRSHLWDFMGRPLDVAAFAGYWRKFGKFGTLRELLEFDVQEKLKEPNPDRPDPLSPQKARQGAEYLAAAAIFCKKLTFTLPNIDLQDEALAPASVLPKHWPSEETAALLNRPLFDEAIYGRVRFHHRQTAEYLAASWLQTLVTEHNCTYPEVRDLLFAENHGHTVMPPSRKSVAAWFAVMAQDEITNRRVREQLVREHPEVLFRYGDPQSLSIPDRKVLFAAIVEKYAGRQQVWLDSDIALLSRLAAPELAEEIHRYILDTTLCNDIRELFLQIIWHGRLVVCLDAVLQILATEGAPEGLKLYAAAAVRDVGLTEHKQQLAQIAETYTGFSSRLCSVLCEALYPDTVGVAGLIGLLEKSAVPKRDSSLELPDRLGELFKNKLPDAHLEKLLLELTRLITQPPLIKFDKKEMPLSVKYRWAGNVLCIVVKRLLQRPALDKSLLEPIIKSIWSLSAYSDGSWGDEGKCSLAEEFRNHPPLRHTYVWQVIHSLKANQQERPLAWHQVHHREKVTGYHTHLSDLDWLLEDIASVSLKADRVIALHLAMNLWKLNGGLRRYAKRFQQAISAQPELQRIFHKEVGNYLFWRLKSYWWRLIYHYGLHDIHSLWWKLRWKTRELKQLFNKRRRLIRYQLRLLWSIQSLREGSNWRGLAKLRHVAHDSIDNEDPINAWKAIIPVYGNRIAQAAKQGWQAFWPTFNPLLPDREETRNHKIRMGLTGLSIAFAEGLDPADLSAQAAAIATAYAVNETINFPDWLSPLAAAHPQSVREVLLHYIREDWKISPDTSHVWDIFPFLYRGQPKVQKLVAEDVLTLLQAEEPQHPTVLNHVLTFLLNIPHPPAQVLSTLAAQRLQLLKADSPQFMSWFIAWMHVDGINAVAFLEKSLTIPQNILDNFMEKFCGAMSPHSNYNHPVSNNSSLLRQPLALEQLIPLVYQHIRPQDDLHHEESYSPKSRDHAQEFRGSLLESLAALADKEAYYALHRLISYPLLSEKQDWILTLIAEHTEQQAEDTWQPQDIAAFAEHHQIRPRSTHSLFIHVLRHLEAIKEAVECSDFSIRAAVRPEDGEYLLRDFIGERLRASAKEHIVVKESEADAGKKTDLRVFSGKLGPITIEIKWNRKNNTRSYNALEKTLTDQLTGLYLRAAHARHGILLIGTDGSQQHWDRRRYDFPALIADLDNKARMILEERTDIDGLRVIGIDFSKPDL